MSAHSLIIFKLSKFWQLLLFATINPFSYGLFSSLSHVSVIGTHELGLLYSKFDSQHPIPPHFSLAPLTYSEPLLLLVAFIVWFSCFDIVHRYSCSSSLYKCRICKKTTDFAWLPLEHCKQCPGIRVFPARISHPPLFTSSLFLTIVIFIRVKSTCKCATLGRKIPSIYFA